MNRRLWIVYAGLFGLATLILCAIPSNAQTQEIKPKPPMYSYVADWQIPRAKWPDVDKAIAPVNDVLQKALNDGSIVGYGKDVNLVHQLDTETHDVWWSAMSMAAIVKTLDRIHAASDTNSAVLNDSRHWDEFFISRYYNWKPGPYKSAYTYVAEYQLKADAPDDAFDNLSQRLVAPLLEKLIANGTILEYEIDTMAVHTTTPGLFYIVYLTPTPEGLDTVEAAIMDAIKNEPLGVQAFGSVTDGSAHRDELDESDGVYK